MPTQASCPERSVARRGWTVPFAAILLANALMLSATFARGETAAGAPETDPYAAMRAGQWAEAERAFFAALKADPQDLTAIAGAGLVAWQQGKTEVAKNRFAQGKARFAESDPDLNNVYDESGKGHLKLLGRLLEGGGVQVRDVEIGSFGGVANVDAAYFAGLRAMENGVVGDARQMFRQAEEADPGRYPLAGAAEKKLAEVEKRVAALEPDDRELATVRYQVEQAFAAGRYGDALFGAEYLAGRGKTLPTYPARLELLSRIKAAKAQADAAVLAAKPAAEFSPAEALAALREFWASGAAAGPATPVAEKAWRRLHQSDPLWPASELLVPLDRAPDGEFGAAVSALLGGPVPLKDDARFRAIAQAELRAWADGLTAEQLRDAAVREHASRQVRAAQAVLLLEVLTKTRAPGDAAEALLALIKQEAFNDPAQAGAVERWAERKDWLGQWGFAKSTLPELEISDLWARREKTPEALRPRIERLARLTALAEHGPALSKGRREGFLRYLWSEAEQIETAARTAGDRPNTYDPSPEDFARHATAGVMIWAAARLGDAVRVRDAMDWDASSDLADADWLRKIVEREEAAPAGVFIHQVGLWSEGLAEQPTTNDKSIMESPAVLLRLLKAQSATPQPAAELIRFYEQQRAKFPWALSVRPQAVARWAQREVHRMVTDYQISAADALPAQGFAAQARLEKLQAFEAAVGGSVSTSAQRARFAEDVAKARVSIAGYIEHAKTRAPTLAESRAAREKNLQAAEARAGELIALLQPIMAKGDVTRAIATLRSFRRDHPEVDLAFLPEINQLEQVLVAREHREFMERQARNAGERFEQNARIDAESAAAAEQRRTSAPGYKPSWDEQWAQLISNAREQNR